MLGESIAIVPRNISKDISLENLLSELTKEGLDATLTHKSGHYYECDPPARFSWNSLSGVKSKGLASSKIAPL